MKKFLLVLIFIAFTGINAYCENTYYEPGSNYKYDSRGVLIPDDVDVSSDIIITDDSRTQKTREQQKIQKQQKRTSAPINNIDIGASEKVLIYHNKGEK